MEVKRGETPPAYSHTRTKARVGDVGMQKKPLYKGGKGISQVRKNT